jgi:hypothetical protein
VGRGLQRYRFERLGEAVGHDGHIRAGTILFRLGEASYLVQSTAPICNTEVRAVAQRQVAAYATDARNFLSESLGR